MSIVQSNLSEAYRLGAKGGPVSESERLLFEEWMRGHCWSVGPRLNDGSYSEMSTRMCWAAWRDRAALSAFISTGTPAISRKDIAPFEFSAWFYVNTVHDDKLEVVLENAATRSDNETSYVDFLMNMMAAEFVNDKDINVSESCEYGRVSLKVSAVCPDMLQIALDRCEKVVQRWLIKYRINGMKKS